MRFLRTLLPLLALLFGCAALGTDPGGDPGGPGDPPGDPPPGWTAGSRAIHACADGAPQLWVAPGGSDASGDGSAAAPWAGIEHALSEVPDGATVWVRPGEYRGQVRLRGVFATGVAVCSEEPYLARLRNDDRVVVAYGTSGEVAGIALEGFDIAHDGPGAGALVVHLDAAGSGLVHDLEIRDNVLHDSWNNDLLKINNGARNVSVLGNLFYNQSGSDEHIDVNSVADVRIEGNVLFNHFEGSGRSDPGNTSSFIVIKDSNGGDDAYTGTRDVTVRRNVFLNWQGSSGSNFVLIGEDGQPFFEADRVLVENNLMLGTSTSLLRAAVGVKGGRRVTFRHNTVSGDLPALAYALRLNREGANPPNEAIAFRGNAWSDPTGTMGSDGRGSGLDFSDTPPGDSVDPELRGNLYWNGGAPLPAQGNELLEPSDDPDAVVGDPGFADSSGATPPRWRPDDARFADGSTRIAEVHTALATRYGTPAAGGAAIDAADPANAPADDLLGRPRGGAPDLGAVER